MESIRIKWPFITPRKAWAGLYYNKSNVLYVVVFKQQPHRQAWQDNVIRQAYSLSENVDNILIIAEAAFFEGVYGTNISLILPTHPMEGNDYDRVEEVREIVLAD